ncbi:hypothetical protein AB1K09_20060 [Solibacillus silvestris]
MFKGLLYDFVSEGKRILIEDFVSVLPEVVGYSAIACGAFIVIAPMIGQDILKPLGIFLTIGICCISILGAV